MLKMLICYIFSFADHLEAMFGPSAPPAPWDLDKKYKTGAFEVCCHVLKEKDVYEHIDNNAEKDEVSIIFRL